MIVGSGRVGLSGSGLIGQGRLARLGSVSGRLVGSGRVSRSIGLVRRVGSGQVGLCWVGGPVVRVDRSGRSALVGRSARVGSGRSCWVGGSVVHVDRSGRSALVGRSARVGSGRPPSGQSEARRARQPQDEQYAERREASEAPLSACLRVSFSMLGGRMLGPTG